MAATIRDLAKHVGLSMSAVSKALNGYPDVSENTRQIVKEAARQLNYQPNMHARALKSKRSYNLGVLFSDDSQSGLTHPFFSVVLEGFKKEAEHNGYDITFIGHRMGQSGITYLDHCRSRELDGICVANTNFNTDEILTLIRSEFPLVTIDNQFPERGCVFADNVGGMSQLVHYVADMGHRKIAYVHGPSSAVTDLRVKTFLQAAKECGLDVRDDYLVQCEYTNPQSCYHATLELLELPDPPTCIFVCDDFSSPGAISAAHQHGLRIPEDLSLVGYDGIEQMQYSYPRLTTVDQDAEQIGRTAARMLISQIEGNPSATEIVPAKLISGETVRMVG